MRKFAVIFLVITLFWQSLALADQGLVSDHAEGVAHAILHWEKANHHHHDDGSIHTDGSDEDSRHVAADFGCLTVAVLPTLPGFDDLSLAAAALLPHVDVVFAPPYLEGPRRPPRPTV